MKESKQAKYYNQNTKELPPLQTREVVRVAPKPGDKERKWFKARVEDQIDIPSYKVRTEDGRLYRRNRRHLRQSKEPFAQTSETSPVRPLQDNLPNTTPVAAEPIRPQLTGQPVQHNYVGQPKQPESVTVSPRQELSSDTAKLSVVTRSGQVSLVLQDFVTAE